VPQAERIRRAYMLIEDESALRERISKMLAEGPKTQTEPFPEDNHQYTIIPRTDAADSGEFSEAVS
jgi:hypothetical protein